MPTAMLNHKRATSNVAFTTQSSSGYEYLHVSANIDISLIRSRASWSSSTTDIVPGTIISQAVTSTRAHMSPPQLRGTLSQRPTPPRNIETPSPRPTSSTSMNASSDEAAVAVPMQSTSEGFDIALISPAPAISSASPIPSLAIETAGAVTATDQPTRAPLSTVRSDFCFTVLGRASASRAASREC